ncbi:hypothetical protein [Lacipirellula limnantheis]|uniref:Allene oxide cyclase barrel-like domain-containing protein n=1 Tax=Lacipirellula limnantheis TaxID=2528024 RepID=A0A517TRV3_9BACT|nr:hypothetical protein [Lacipirellula limnantheis]QDT71106.1 hypothetical protein I41_02610 [Lacipirellula limnantheis]
MRMLPNFIRATLLLAAVAILSLSFAALRVSAAEAAQAATAKEEQQLTEPTAEQVADLEKLMNRATMVGHFTVTGGGEGNKLDGGGGKLTEERYELGEVKRLESGDWLIQSRIRYGDHDVTIPLTLPIRWAGDTPVICVDDMLIPGLGTFTARVMIYRGHYAGFWTGADHGGHLFGVIEAAKEE